MGSTSMSPRRRLLRLGLTAAAVAGLTLASAGPAFAQASSTTVTPAGHGLSATVVSGTTADFVVGSVTTRCNTSATTGQIPDEPDNHNPAGPVNSTVAPPSFTNNGAACPTNVIFTTATTQANSTNGDWVIGMQDDPAGATGSLTIPQGGVTVQTSGLASCTITVAPTGPVTITGAFVPATGSSAPELDLSAGVNVPITVTGGFGCPTTATSAVFTARYAITNTTDPAQPITVGP